MVCLNCHHLFGAKLRSSVAVFLHTGIFIDYLAEFFGNLPSEPRRFEHLHLVAVGEDARLEFFVRTDGEADDVLLLVGRLLRRMDGFVDHVGEARGVKLQQHLFGDGVVVGQGVAKYVV